MAPAVDPYTVCAGPELGKVVEVVETANLYQQYERRTPLRRAPKSNLPEPWARPARLSLYRSEPLPMHEVSTLPARM